jgi:DHA2 family methylenomycin A resistance protein-like MFS transporter
VAIAVLALVLGAGTPYWLIAVTMCVSNLGLGFASPAMTATMMASIRTEDGGIAGAMMNVNRQIGSLVGVGLFSGMLATSNDWYTTARSAFGVAFAAYLAGVLAAIRIGRGQHSAQASSKELEPESAGVAESA